MMAAVGSDDRFVLLGVEHLGALTVIALATAILATTLRHFRDRPSGRGVCRTICWSLAVAMIASQFVEQIRLIAGDAWTVQESLPLHLCDLAVFAVAFVLVCVAERPRPQGASADPRLGNARRLQQTFYELTYFWSLGGTVQALLTPDLADSFPSPWCVQYFVSHGTVVVSVLVLTISLGMRPGPGSVLRAWILTNAVAVMVMLFNAAAGANYMYLCGPPGYPSLYDHFGPWPWSLITLEIVGTVIFVLCYAPIWLMKRLGQEHRR